MTIGRREFLSVLLFPRQATTVQLAVLETFAIREACDAVLVHHSDEASRESFARWLQANRNASIRVRTSSGAEVAATIFRVRMCFGRGLILLKEPLRLREKEVISILISR